jgi:acyl-CoA synthetase (AMP-forming)/AMP-acid ligase II
MVTGGEKAAPPSLLTVQAAALSRNRVESAAAGDEGARTLVSCGREPWGQELRVVNPETLVECLPDEVGEIFVRSPSVAKGYWGNPEESARTFGARLADTGEGPFLRTGDLGFVRDCELFLVGRLKDLIIIGGRNLHPQDIEQTVEQSHAALRPGCGAAFSVEHDGEERLVVVHEVERRHRGPDFSEVLTAIRRAVSEEHQAQVHGVALVRHGSILKTSSGKIQRHSCRAAFLAGTLDLLGGFNLEAARPAAAEPQLTTA